MTPMPDVEAIAQVCHDANAAWCYRTGDPAAKYWSEAPGWQVQSAIAGVRFALANPDAPDASQHDAWMADKLADGWVYGPVKDPVAKTHPCLVPFDELPADQQAKDRLFRAIVRALTPPVVEAPVVESAAGETGGEGVTVPPTGEPVQGASA